MKFRVIVNGVSFYATDAAIKRGVGDFSLINTAVQLCRDELGESRGLAKTFTIFDHKMVSKKIEVQLDRV